MSTLLDLGKITKILTVFQDIKHQTSIYKLGETVFKSASKLSKMSSLNYDIY